MNNADSTKKRTWEQRGSAEDDQNKKTKGSLVNENPQISINLNEDSDSDTDTVFQVASDTSPSDTKMAAQGVDILSQLITAL